ncbi:ABC transporter ATP-binding protein [uncultured Roseobacter sp.]|uniref:ABC transporter ATP-binding protein n=1 Tax=uncultured Roseobacter sp. TaxID=114847 RepID=UPI00260F6EBF|nr:ABC transporter ATP-binding protein [uncultured Roseobacter sp.]
MIPRLIDVAGPDFRTPLHLLIAGLVVEATLVGVGFAVLVPFLDALLNGDTATALRWWWGLLGVFALYTLLRWKTQFAGYMNSVALARALFARLGAHIARLPLGWFSDARTGELGVLTSQGVIDIMTVPAHLLRPILVAMVTPVVVLIFMLAIDWQLAVSVALVAPFAVLASVWSGTLIRRSDARMHAASVDAANRIVEFARAQPVLRAFGQIDAESSDLDAALVETHAAARTQMTAVARGLLAFTLVVQLGLTALLIVGVNRVLGGGIGAPELAAFLVLGLRFAEPLIGAADMQGALRMSDETLLRMQKLLSIPTLPEPDTPKAPKNHAIGLQDVHFGYAGAPVLHGLSFTVPDRGFVALVGSSGAGKTTILRLIARFFDPDKGSVSLGGVDLRKIGSTRLMRDIAIVFQDVYLFAGTIAENLRLARPGATEAELATALETAQLGPTLQRLPDGIDTQVGEGGVALSGGERQRVSIARALLKDTPLVLLDEATASLDALDERRLRNALEAMAKERTVVAVAHRLSTIMAADKIVFIENGQVAEEGTHDALIAQGGRYAAFWDLNSPSDVEDLSP